MSSPAAPRFRQVHLDFHTSPLIPDVGRDFDADEFARVLDDAHVDSVTCFAKCHHGMCYYPTKIGPVHRSLKFDLLGAQIEACHKRDFRVPIYLTCVWDNYMADQHPDWQQRRLDGTLFGAKDGEAGWKWICLNSPYIDYQEQQTRELLDSYDVDGFFYDIVWQANERFPDQSGCCCEYCLASMKKLNLNPESLADHGTHSQFVIDTFMARLSGMIRSRKPDATIFYNGRVRQGMGHEAAQMTHAEIEALPTGGWGYGYYPFWVRYARHFGIPTMGMTGRFHRSWEDFGGLKSAAALRFECGAMLANGSVCSIGDQLHPRGRLDRAVYEVVGEAFADVATVEEWCIGASPQTEIALVLVENANRKTSRNDSDEGAAKALLELHHQFDILDAEADWTHTSLLVIADRGKPTPELTARLRDYLRNGGKLLLSHEALVDPETNEFVLAEDMGVSYDGPCQFKPSFFRLRPNFRHGIADFEWVMMGGGSNVRPGPVTDVLADVYGSYFNRTTDHFTSHGYSPRTDPTGHPAVTWHGNIAYLYGPFFADYQTHGDAVYRRVIGNTLNLLLPERLIVTNAPPTTEVTVTVQGDRTIVHVVNYHPNRRGGHVEVIEDVIPLRDVSIGLRSNREPSKAYLAPDGVSLEMYYLEGRAHVVVPRVEEHAMVVFEI